MSLKQGQRTLRQILLSDRKRVIQLVSNPVLHIKSY